MYWRYGSSNVFPSYANATQARALSIGSPGGVGPPQPAAARRTAPNATRSTDPIGPRTRLPCFVDIAGVRLPARNTEGKSASVGGCRCILRSRMPDPVLLGCESRTRSFGGPPVFEGLTFSSHEGLTQDHDADRNTSAGRRRHAGVPGHGGDRRDPDPADRHGARRAG